MVSKLNDLKGSLIAFHEDGADMGQLGDYIDLEELEELIQEFEEKEKWFMNAVKVLYREI